MTWVFYSLLAAMLWAIVNVTDKYTMDKLVTNPMIPVLILGLVQLITAVSIYCFYGYAFVTSIDLTLAFLAGLFYVATMFFYYQAIKKDEISKLIPLYYLAPVFILLIAQFMMNENLFHNQYWGIGFLVSGAILISLPTPFKLRFNEGAGYMLLAAFFYALNQVLTKYLLKENDFWSVFAYVRIGIFLSLLPLFYWVLIYKTDSYRNVSYQAYGIMVSNQLLNIAGVFAITVALTQGYVTLVNALASVQPFFVLILTTALGIMLPNIIKESMSSSALIKKFLAIALIFIGMLAVR